MTARITRRPTLVDGVAQAGRWWWRYWERFFEAGGGLASTAFTAEDAEDADYVGVEEDAGYAVAEEDAGYAVAEEDAGYAVAEDARFRNLTGRSFLNFGYSASGMARGEENLGGAAGVGGRDTVRGGDRLRGDRADRNARSTTGGVRRVTPASLILGNSSGGTRQHDPIHSNEDHPLQRVRRAEATKEDGPERLPSRGRSIAATRSAGSVGSVGSVVESSSSASSALSALSAVKRSSAPTPDPVPCD